MRAETVIFFGNTDWYLYNFRLPLAEHLRTQGIETIMVSPPGAYGRRLRAAGFRWEAVPMERRSLNPLREVKLIGHLLRLFRRERPRLVHGFTIKCAVYGSLAARLARVPARIAAVAGLGYVFASDAPLAQLLRPIVRGLLRLALSGSGARLILQNQDDEIVFRSARLVRPERIRVIPGSGVNCRRFRPRSNRDERVGPFRVILATRLLWEKGVGEYVEAARLLRDEGRSVRFLLAGEPDPGSPASVPIETVRAWARDDLVEWVGHVDEMADLLADVDAMALPSYYREGVPRTLIEGAAAGLPLVTTDTPGCRDVVTDGVEGLLVPTRDAPALARAIALLQDDPALSRRLGQASRSKAMTVFDEKIVFERTLAVYREVMPAPTTEPSFEDGTPP